MRKPKPVRGAASKGSAPFKAQKTRKQEPQIGFGRTGVVDYGVDAPRKKKPGKRK